MCVIIHRLPKVIIPEDKIVSACLTNPDGFGISILNDDRLETVKIHESKGNNPKDIMKALEDAKDNEVYLHLRYTTAGKTNEDNCHPFQVFKGDNYEIQFMHNGTLGAFSKGKDHDYSDTWHFNEEILKPTIRAFYEVEGAGVLLSPVVKRILHEFKGGGVFVLYDNEGNRLTVENSACKQFDGWWASNEYSFNRNHRTPVTYSPQKSTYNIPFRGGGETTKTTSPSSSTPPANVNITKGDVSRLSEAKGQLLTLEEEECQKAGFHVKEAKKHKVANSKLTEPKHRYTFADMAEIENLKDVMLLTEDEIYDLCNELPIAATALIMDLIYELYQKEEKAKKEEALKAEVLHG